jgi:hypothetical protein
MGLDSFFLIGSSAIVSAQNTFTNRTEEMDAFGKAIESRRSLSQHSVALVEDLIAPRANVLTFYGFGGIGKSRLSRELENRYRRDVAGEEVRLSFRMDFDSAAALDYESLLLGLRAVLGKFRSVWPAFDLAFAVYWERAHPGQPLQEALNNSSTLRRIDRELHLGTQLQNAVEGLLKSYGGVLGVFTAGARVVGRSVREHILTQKLMSDCPFFGPIINESDSSAMRIYLSSLLAWDLARRQEARVRRGRRLELTVFFDTWERLQEGQSYMGDAEDMISRLIYLMPNVLFVITGRNQLRWADEESRACMQWAGPERWPYLADTTRNVEPTQHLVGSLSAKDADRFLTLRLQRANEPLIPLEVRRSIISASGGVPLYLDVAAVRYAQMLSQGKTITAGDLGQPFAELVLRIMKDLNSDQRTLLRMASMVSRFDEELLRVTSPSLPDSSLAQFIRRSLVQRFPNDFLPYGIHEALRDAVREADIGEDHWSEREWAVAAEKLSSEIHRRIRPELVASGSVDGGMLAGYFLEAFRLAVCTRRIEPWIWELAGRLHSLGAMDALAAVNAVVPEGSPLRTASHVLAAIASRRALGPQQTADTLGAAMSDAKLDETGREYVGYWLGWMLDELGRWEEAEALRRRLVRNNSSHFAPYLWHALARNDWVCGRLSSALSLSARFDESDPLQRFWKTGIDGRVAWILGHFEEADEQYICRIEGAVETGSPDLLAHALRTRAELVCFTDPTNEEAALEAIEIYQRMGVPVSESESRAALEIARCGREDLSFTVANIDALRATFGDAPHADVAEIFALCVTNDSTSAESLRRRLIRIQRGPAYGYWTYITGWWIEEVTGESQPTAPSHVEWLHGSADARERWTQVLRDRRILARSYSRDRH